MLARAGHPPPRAGKLSLAAWLAHPHIVVRTGNTSASVVGEVLTRAAARREVGPVVPGFLSAMIAAAETDFFFNAPRELVADLAPRLGLVAYAPPVALPALPVAALWHERFHDDPAHTFFRDRTIAAVRRDPGRTRPRPSPAR